MKIEFDFMGNKIPTSLAVKVDDIDYRIEGFDNPEQLKGGAE